MYFIIYATNSLFIILWSLVITASRSIYQIIRSDFAITPPKHDTHILSTQPRSSSPRVRRISTKQSSNYLVQKSPRPAAIGDVSQSLGPSTYGPWALGRRSILFLSLRPPPPDAAAVILRYRKERSLITGLACPS